MKVDVLLNKETKPTKLSHSLAYQSMDKRKPWQYLLYRQDSTCGE